MSSPKTIYIAIIGLGGVGKAFLSQLEALSHRYLSHSTSPTHLSLIYASRSSKSLLAPFAGGKSLNYQSLLADLDASTTSPLSVTQLIEHLRSAPNGSRSILIDNTSNQSLAETYPLFLQQGISICTPNKKAFSDKLELWDSIFSVAANGNGDPKKAGYVFHESSVGAGLPIICTLKDLLETGDIVTKIEGVFSGTMSFLFNNFMPVGGGGGKFSAEVSKAKELGYTEPDPRDDLNGLDVARKATILARLAGLKVSSPTSFPVQSLIPKELESCQSGDEFMKRLPEFDSQVDAVKKEAEAEGKVLRFVGSVDVQNGAVEVGLKKFDVSHPIAALKGSDNIINFYTKRYGASPLIVQGAGAGAEVTAMGVIADVIRVCGLLQGTDK